MADSARLCSQGDDRNRTVGRSIYVTTLDLCVMCGGAQVTYKRTDFLHDQVLLSGFAAGGLTEVPQPQHRTAAFANTIAGELGMFGLRPEVCLVSATSCVHAWSLSCGCTLLPNPLGVLQ